MKNDLTCGVVRDLLPSYVEGLTSPESNTAVERHLSGCPECAQLDEYAALRTRRCRKMHVKTSCDACENHCYKPEMRERIRQVMRYSGPRMITRHPIAAIRHLLGR